MFKVLFRQHLISILSGLIPIIILQWYISPSGFYNMIFCFDVLLLFFFANRKEKIIRHQGYIKFTFALCIAYAFCALVQRGAVNANILTKIIVSSLLAYSFLINDIRMIYMKIAHIYIALFCIYNIRKYGFVPFESASINTVSIFVIIVASTINFIELKNTQNLSIVPSVVSVVSCIFGDSRNGLITSLLYFGAIFALTWHNTTKYQRYLLFGIVSYSVYVIGNNITSIFEMHIFDRFDYRGLDLNYRDVLWQGYLDKVNVTSFVAGVDYNDVPEIVSFSENRNPHSSFIQAHNKFGVIGLWLLIFIFSLIVRLLKNKQYAICAIIIAVLSRCFTDSVFFVNMFDYFIFMIILLINPEIGNEMYFGKQAKVIKN